MIDHAVRRWLPINAAARRLIRNVGLIVSGDAGASALGLASLALTARALGPELLGILVMIEAYTNLIDRWVRPETWQVLIKYGSDALSTDDRGAFKRLVKFCVLIDAAGALLAIVLAYAGVTIAASWFGWSDETAGLAGLFCIVLIAKMTSTSTAVLRLFDRYAVFAYSQIISATARLVLVAIAWWFGGELLTFLLIFMAVAFVRPALMIHAAIRELSHRGYKDIASVPVGGVTEQYPRLWRFLASANLSLLLRKTVENTDVLIVGLILGPASSGGLHIAKRLANVILKLGRPVQQVIYPDVSKLWAKGETRQFSKAVIWTNLVAGAAGIAALGLTSIDSAFAMKLFAGEAFTDWSTVLLVQMLAMVIFMFGLALRPALYSMEQDWALLKAVALATIVFYLTFFGLIAQFGVMAASLGHCAFNLVWLFLCLRCFRSHVAARLTT